MDLGLFRQAHFREDLLWVATSFETFDLLHDGRSLSANEAAGRALAIASVGLKQQPVRAARER